MIIRVRATVATWRVEVSGPEASVQELMHAIALAKNVSVDCQSLSSDAAGKHVLSGASTLAQSGLGAPGSMVYLRVSGVELAPEGNLDAMDGMRGAPRRRIGADGAIVTAGYDEFTSAKGFRPGMSALRDMKKQWTLTQFLELDDQFNFPIKRQEKTHAKAVSLDGESCVAFQAYAAQRGWRAQRFGHLLGSFEDEGVVRVEAIYEPPQDGHAQGVTLLDDALASGVDAVANALGLKRVGCIFSHPPREAGFVFSGAEVIRSAELQLDCANGVEETPFVSVRVTCDEAGAAVFEAYQVSLQAMAMVAEGALSGDAADGAGLKVHDTFTAVVAGKAEKKVDAQFFLCNVAVKQHASTLLRASFPKENRLVNRTRLDLKQQLQRARASGEPVVAGISDFGLLTFLLESPQVFDHASFLPALCETGV